jgi:hypothetical protein
MNVRAELASEMTATPPKMGARDYCSLIEASLKALDNSLDELFARFEPALEPEYPSPEIETKESEIPPTSEINYRLEKIARFIDRRRYSVDSVIERVQL